MSFILPGMSGAASRFPKFSLDADGSADVVVIGAPMSGIQSIGTGDFTFVIWVKPTSFASLRSICSLTKNATSLEDGFNLYIQTTGTLTFQNREGTGGVFNINTTDTLSTSAFGMITLTRTGTTGKVYINDGTGTAVSGTNAEVGYSIGASHLINLFSNVGTIYFYGIAAQCTMWNSILSDSEIVALYNSGLPRGVLSDSGNYVSSANVVGHWGFDEGNGSIANDTSGNGNDGTISGATWSNETPY